MKMLFLTPNELSHTMEEIFATQGKEVTCSTGFSEKTEQDILTIAEQNAVQELPIEELFAPLNERYHVDIERYDVMEVGDFGDGFVFFLH